MQRSNQFDPDDLAATRERQIARDERILEAEAAETDAATLWSRQRTLADRLQSMATAGDRVAVDITGHRLNGGIAAVASDHVVLDTGTLLAAAPATAIDGVRRVGHVGVPLPPATPGTWNALLLSLEGRQVRLLVRDGDTVLFFPPVAGG